MKFQLEAKEWDYYKDQLTGLDNRFVLLEYIKLNSRLNIFVVNIDNFSNINSIYGYVVGDEILIEITKHLQILKPNNAKLFRFDSDEFIFVVNDFMNFRELKEFAEALLSFFNQIDIELAHDNIIAKVSLSIGIAMGNGIVTLNHAVMALKEVRLYTKNSYKIFEGKSTFFEQQQRDIYWIHKIYDAIEEENIMTFFQPIFNIETGKIEKFESLARIQDGEKTISPMHFMEACRLTGTLSLITKNMIRNACQKFAHTSYVFSINITLDDIQQNYLEDFLLSNTKKYNLDPSQVILEILEDIVTLMGNGAIEQLNHLRSLGFKIALDDFGASNSNFSRIMELEPDFLKIDGMFIKDIVEDDKSRIIVESIVDFCKKIGAEVIAEHVHNKKVLEKVEALGIKYAQGYYIGEPKKSINN